MKRNRKLLYAAVMASLAAAFMGAGPLGAQTPKAGGTLRYGTVTEVSSLDPHVYSGSAWKVLIEALYSPLVGFDQSGKIAPRLAERWETPDPKTTMFHLRRGATFHDGSPVTAEDVKFSFERILNPATGATVRTNLEGVKVTVVDESAVKLETPQPNATLLSVLALPEAAIVSKTWMQGGPNVKVQANGTGPFRLKAYEPSVRAQLEKNPNYIVKGLPRLDNVEFRMIKSDDARVNALRTGSVDMIDFVPWKDIDALRRQPNLTVDSSGGAFMNIWFNATKKPFDDPRLRKAFAYAIDRAGISKAAFFGHGSPIFGPPTTPDSPFYNKELENTFGYDPQQAKKLLAEAGHPNGFEFEFLIFQGLGIYTSTAQIIQQNLKEIGITANIKLVEFATLLEHKNNANYDAMIYGVSVKLADPDAYAYYFGADSSYWAKPIGYRDETLEKLLTEGRSTLDENARKGIYRKVEERLLETSPWVFINWREQAQGYRRNVKGYKHLGGALNESSAGISLPTMWIE
jgi:peptide/nickel transport system substrate-binding protein